MDGYEQGTPPDVHAEVGMLTIPWGLLRRRNVYSYLSFLAALVVVVTVFAALVGSGCFPGLPVGAPPPINTSPSGAGTVPGVVPEVITSISGTASPLTAGQQVSRVLAMSSTSGAALLVEVRYFPVDSASNIMFSGSQPKNPAGPAPYIFENVALGAFERDIGVTYNAPAPWNKLPSVNLEDMFTVRVTAGAGQWHDSYSVLPSTVLAAGSAATPQELPPADADSGSAGKTDTAALAVGANSAASYSWWYTEFYFGLGQSTTMTTDLCQNSVGYLQGGNFFVAVRYPTSAAAGASSAIPGPFRYGETNGCPRLDLLNETPWPNTVVVSMPLAVAPEWMTYAANSLPQAAGERWVTMAPSSETQATCPANLNLPNWEFYAYVPMDAGSSPAAWSEKVLLGYFCFVTTSPPPFLESVAAALGLEAEEADTTSAQVTAMGPFPIRLMGSPPNPPYVVSGPQMAQVKSPGQAQLLFLIENKGGQTVTVTLATTSTQQLPWRLYNGTYAAPNSASPITGPITITANNAAPVWLLASVPVGANGAETVVLTASSTSPAGSTWNSGLVWLGNPPNLGRTIRRHLPHK